MHVCVLTLYIILVFLFIMRVLRKPTSPPLNLKFFLKSTRPSFLIKLAALGNLKVNFHCAHLHNLSPQGTGDVPTALLVLFSKINPSFFY